MRGLDLALQKTEVVILTGRRVPTIIPVTVGNVEMQTRSEAKYLGVYLDTKLNFKYHVRQAADRAMNRVAALSRLMANVRGPGPSKRRLLMSTTHSIMLYGAEVWAPALRMRTYRVIMGRVQRKGALRIASAYRTVSEKAVLVIAGVIPINLWACKRKRIYDRDPGTVEAAALERERTLGQW